MTCVMVTHDQEEAMTMADRVAVMQKGSFLQIGQPREVYETPASRFVADFIGNVNLFDGVVEVDEADHVVIKSPECVHYVSHGITGTQGMEVGVAIRPEKIALLRSPPTLEQRESPGEDGLNFVKCVVKNTAYLGSYTTYHVQTENGKMLRVTLTNAARHEDNHFNLEDEVYAWWDGSDIVVLTQ